MERGVRDYSVDDLEMMLRVEYGRIPHNDLDAYEFLKEEMGLKEGWLPEEVYRIRHNRILQVLSI